MHTGKNGILHKGGCDCYCASMWACGDWVLEPDAARFHPRRRLAAALCLRLQFVVCLLSRTLNSMNSVAGEEEWARRVSKEELYSELLMISKLFSPFLRLPDSVLDTLQSGHLEGIELSTKGSPIFTFNPPMLEANALHNWNMDGPTGRGAGAEMPLQNYTMGKTLGHGSFGKVKIAEHRPTGYKMAVKILNCWKMKSHNMEEKDIYVVMEYVKSGELFEITLWRREDYRRMKLGAFSNGLFPVRSTATETWWLVHRDLKLENLLLHSRGNVPIDDFGLSDVMRDVHFLKTICGSPNYATPEVVSGKLYAAPEIDVWSCGVILYAIICRTLPFDDENIPNLFKKIKVIVRKLSGFPNCCTKAIASMYQRRRSLGPPINDGPTYEILKMAKWLTPIKNINRNMKNWAVKVKVLEKWNPRSGQHSPVNSVSMTATMFENQAKEYFLVDGKTLMKYAVEALKARPRARKVEEDYEDAKDSSVPIIHIEEDMFILVDDVLLPLKRAALEPLPPKDDKGPRNRMKVS
ncbi:hypothetical protein RHMOL_Rhmol06G0145300 [Rhododendron molle]|uniref:Uncharacterized protein n=1 Tax=Rhododendron molle TaxID=49168 RepID=A0ACC0NDF4_RHOML|nr:hypothetical protein RHMOL_Rhmol06G0145300 [Rhododendron molle]